MKRVCADLHLCPDLREPEQAMRLVCKAAKLGYRLVALTFPPDIREEQLKQLRMACGEAEADLAIRLDLKPRTPEELIGNLRRFRRKFEIVAVACESKNVARQAAKDRRVDLLNFPSPDFRRRFFDPAEAELASESSVSLEIDMKPLLVLEGSARSMLLSSLRREVAIAQEFHVPIVISSGVSDGLLMRKPSEYAALASLFDLNKVSALDAVSKNPTAIVKKNREKLDPGFVAPGIRIIRRGKDC